MKKVFFSTVLLVALCAVARAGVIQLTPFGTGALSTFYIDKNGTGPGNGNDSVSQLYRLNTYFVAGPDIVVTDSLKPATQVNDWSAGGLGDWDYVVIHFGAGAYGGSGGSVGAWFLNGESSFTFPSEAFSSIDFFRVRAPDQGPKVPDTGSTLALTGFALAALSFVRRFRTRR